MQLHLSASPGHHRTSATVSLVVAAVITLPHGHVYEAADYAGAIALALLWSRDHANLKIGDSVFHGGIF